MKCHITVRNTLRGHHEQQKPRLVEKVHMHGAIRDSKGGSRVHQWERSCGAAVRLDQGYYLPAICT